MKIEKILRDLSLRAITFLVILIILWSIVLLVGATFNWSFLTSKIQGAFYLGGFIVGLLILALSFLNLTSSLTIISKAQNKEEAVSRGIRKQIGFMLLGAFVLIGLLIGGLWFAEWRVYRQVSEEAITKVQTIAAKKQFSELAQAVKTDGDINDILEIRDALANYVGSGGRVSFLIPRDRAGVKVYYEIVPWLRFLDKDKTETKKLSDMDLNRFQPSRREEEDFKKLAAGEISSFQAPVGGDKLRVFQSEKIDGQEIVILLDTSRQVNDYRGSFK